MAWKLGLIDHPDSIGRHLSLSNQSMNCDLPNLVSDIADVLVSLDGQRSRFKEFQPGVGPFGEPQLMKLIANELNAMPSYLGKVMTKRTPDLLITGEWAIEAKIARPFGDNGKQAENWSVNLLHPYKGNTSALGDCMKLSRLSCLERKASVVIGFEHDPPLIPLDPLLSRFRINR